MLTPLTAHVDPAHSACWARSQCMLSPLSWYQQSSTERTRPTKADATESFPNNYFAFRSLPPPPPPPPTHSSGLACLVDIRQRCSCLCKLYVILFFFSRMMNILSILNLIECAVARVAELDQHPFVFSMTLILLLSANIRHLAFQVIIK